MATSGERILVVESDPQIRDLISRQALQPLGYQVTLVDRASAALQQAFQTSPDLLIANLNLPGLNAKDLLIALSSQGISAPLIVVAKEGQEQDILQAFRMGAVDYIHWPAKDTEVLAVVERALRHTRESRARQQADKKLQQVNQELQRKIHELTTILSIGKAVISNTNQRKLFTQIVEGALQVASADLGWLMLRDEASKVYLLTAFSNLPEGWAQKLNQPLDDGISSLVSLSGETLLIHGKPLERFEVASLGKAAAIVPIKVQSEVIGLLIVVRKAERPIDTSAQMLLEAVADYASISLVNARLFQALEQTAKDAKVGEKRQSALLESIREAVQGELKTITPSIDFLLSEETGDLSKQQRQALQSAQASLRRLSRGTENTTPPVTPDLNKT